MERKEAIEVIKKNWPDSSFTILREALETLIPELRESDGERIRKEIIDYLRDFIPHHDDELVTKSKEWIEWLEKLGEPKSTDKIEPKFHKGDIITSSKNRKIKYLIKKVGVKNEIGELDYVVESIADNEFKGNTYNMSINKVDSWGVLVEDSSVEDNKVGPKFKIGDWIVKNDDSSINVDYSICKITNIKDGNYTIESTRGYKGYNTFETFEKDYHIFTIEDVKDGDVLIAPNGTTFLFKNIINGMPYSYCGIDCTTRFRNTILEGGKDGRNWTSSLKGIYPATKEQRDTLFLKMKEAGYVWNEKELKLEKV